MLDKVCKNCGKRLSDFYSTGMLGCPVCYLAFEMEITNSVSGFNKNYNHKGKSPKFNNLDKELLREYNALLKEREKAGLEGRFNDMKELSEQIYDLNEEIKRRGLI